MHNAAEDDVIEAESSDVSAQTPPMCPLPCPRIHKRDLTDRVARALMEIQLMRDRGIYIVYFTNPFLRFAIFTGAIP